MARILVIDDDSGVRRSLERLLGLAGHAVTSAATGERGLELALPGAFDVILSDMKMPGLSGIDVLREIRARGIDTALIIMTGFGTVDSAVEAMKLGAADYVQKPFFRDELLLRVRAAAERRQLARHVQLLQRHIPGGESLSSIVGSSDAIERVRGFIRQAGPAKGAVLITGETGTGKELVARAVHRESPRRERPFVAVNCAALTESLLEAELFGHTRGAFTGAASAREGLLEHADQGTLFLDEIGAMSKHVQAKLLRVLESGEIRRVGENETRHVDVRFISATNIDLPGAVRAGDFREDLYYRLHVLHTDLPPLRHRGTDVLELADYFLARYGAPAGIGQFSEEARAMLGAYDYPGNVRQLEHIVQRAVAVSQGPLIECGDLPDEMKSPRVSPPAGTVASARLAAEREQILSVLTRNDGDLARTAHDLNVSRTTLWRLMRKHAISPS